MCQRVHCKYCDNRRLAQQQVNCLAGYIHSSVYTAEPAEVMFASVDRDGNGAIVEDKFIGWSQQAADVAAEENEQFMSRSISDSEDGQLNDCSIGCCKRSSLCKEAWD